MVFLHGQMQSDTQIHLLRRLQCCTLMITDDVTRKQEIETGIRIEFVARLIQETCRCLQFFLCIMFQDITAIKMLCLKIPEFVIKSPKTSLRFLLRKLPGKMMRQQPCGDAIPGRGLRPHHLYSSPRQSTQFILCRHAHLPKGLIFFQEYRSVRTGFRKILFNLGQAYGDVRDVKLLQQLPESRRCDNTIHDSLLN